MKTWITRKGATIIRILSGRCNCYLIRKGKITILVDTGVGRNRMKLYRRLKTVLQRDEGLGYLLLTHTHFDHAANTKFVKEMFNPMVMVHEYEIQNLKAGFSSIPAGTGFITRPLMDLGRRYLKNIGKFEALTPDITVSGTLLLEHNPGLKVISTPGHSFGSLCLVLDDEIVLAGDTLFGVFPGRTLPPFGDDITLLMQSWKLLLDTSGRLFLPGHGMPRTREQLRREWLHITHRNVAV